MEQYKENSIEESLDLAFKILEDRLSPWRLVDIDVFFSSIKRLSAQLKDTPNDEILASMLHERLEKIREIDC